jgi:signal transduction histidine kinase
MEPAAPSLSYRLAIRITAVYALTVLVAVIGFVVWGEATGATEHRHGFSTAARAVAAGVAAGETGATIAARPELASLRNRLGDFGFAAWDADTAAPVASHPPRLTALVGQLGELPRLLTEGSWPRTEIRVEKAGAQRIVVAFVWTGTGAWAVLSWVADELTDELLPVLVPMLLVTLLVAPITVRSALRPLNEAARRFDEAGTARIAPYPTDGVPREALPFLEAANAALARRAEMVERQRRFTADAAHALRTPLTALRLRLDALAPGPESATLQSIAERLSRLVARLLDHARLDAGHALARDEMVDVAALARQACANLAPIALDMGRRLSFAGGEAAPPIRGNAAAIADALDALIDNALQASPDGGEVEVATMAGPVVEVRDRGRGLGAEEREAVFAPFARGRGSAYQGSGLGLAVARATVEQHGGRLTLLPREGGGLIARMDLDSQP